MDKLDNSCEPMDIDLSGNSTNAMDISFANSEHANSINSYVEAVSIPAHPIKTEQNGPLAGYTTTQAAPIKRFHINRHKEIEIISRNTTKLIVCAVVILFLSGITYQVLNIQCSDYIHPGVVRNILSTNLYGQSLAIDSLIEALSVKEKSKILFFYGCTGVGKTFTASLIMKHLGQYSNVYHYMMPSFVDTFTTDFMTGLTVCKHTIIIVDDLSVNDVNIQFHVKGVIAKSQNLNKDITVILIYNCDNVAKDFERQCDDTFPSKLLHNVHNINAFKKVIKFEPLREEHLRQCIDTELGNRTLTNSEYEKVLKNFNVSLDGCKGVHTKIKLLEIS